jgi:hypothetical protein
VRGNGRAGHRPRQVKIHLIDHANAELGLLYESPLILLAAQNLFEAQCHNRIEPRGPLRRIEAKRDPHDASKSTSQDDRPGAYQDRPTGFQRNCNGGGPSQKGAGAPASAKARGW